MPPTLSFSASGSTSQAANTIEAMEAGAGLFLIDEDTREDTPDFLGRIAPFATNATNSLFFSSSRIYCWSSARNSTFSRLSFGQEEDSRVCLTHSGRKSNRKLQTLLRQIDHKSYPAYKDTRGKYQFQQYVLSIDHVQGEILPSSKSQYP